MVHPLDHPEIRPLFTQLLHGIGDESDRGAVLIGCAHVDNILKSLFEATFPAGLSKRRRRELLGYPGSLGTFSARIEIAYCTRLISESLYKALQALRTLRNDLAHSPDAFQLRGKEHLLAEIYQIGGSPDGIPKLAADMLARAKIDMALKFAREQREDGDDLPPVVTTELEAVEFIRGNAELMEGLRNQAPQWAMVLAITLICATIVIQRDAAVEALGPDGTLWRTVHSRADSAVNERASQPSAPSDGDADHKDSGDSSSGSEGEAEPN